MDAVNQLAQWGPVAVIVGGYLLGMYFQNRRIDDLRDSMNKRFDDTNKRFDDMNKRFDDMRELLKSEVQRVEQRIDRLQHPIAS
ncbi:MAG TPA: hypothetical protein VKX49_30210 [Bryobacteraceae bacterium]|nr:hypothetical protein [Bryobacteraceae bacterium]